MQTATTTNKALLLRSHTVFRPRQSAVAGKYLRAMDTVMDSKRNSSDLLVAFSAGACATALAVMIVLTFAGSTLCK